MKDGYKRKEFPESESTYSDISRFEHRNKIYKIYWDILNGNTVSSEEIKKLFSDSDEMADALILTVEMLTL